MKDGENEVQTDRSDILKTCTHFCLKLYSSTLLDRHPSQKNTSLDTSEVPPIIASEVKKTQNEMKSKASSKDNLRNDVMVFGGKESVKQKTNIFNQI